MQEFRQRFDPAGTKGEGTRRLKNLYFLYLIELRALSKVAPYFDRSVINLYTGNNQEDGATKDLLLQIFNETRWGEDPTHYTTHTTITTLTTIATHNHYTHTHTLRTHSLHTHHNHYTQSLHTLRTHALHTLTTLKTAHTHTH